MIKIETKRSILSVNYPCDEAWPNKGAIALRNQNGTLIAWIYPPKPGNSIGDVAKTIIALLRGGEEAVPVYTRPAAAKES